MKYFIQLIILFVFVSSSTFAQTSNSAFFQKADKFFKSHVQNGKVNYKKAKQGNQLDDLIKDVANFNISNTNDASKQAFYINAYNLIVIDQILDHYPVESPLKVSGFFDSTKFKVAGQNITLNQLEKDNLLKTYGDARYHFVLVCGANGCPPIVNFAYTPEKLESQLERQTKLALNDKMFIKDGNGEHQISQIFEWYINDFGNSKAKTIEFINKYRTSKLNTNSPVSYYEYNWTLNDI